MSSKKRLHYRQVSAKIEIRGAMPNKKAPHGAFLLHRYKQSLDAMIAFQTKPEALLRFENARVFATFHTGIPTPVSMGDAMLIL
jgi:hypothetical protein|uniref:Uncharacterized protein n=1 Tax=Siphoviridae sp. ctTgb17 TaxID=2825521 RepID=A0A8S5TWX2_9CAUD|nr:MAG TPA: hypothetical protein [Siphoviridae sp. ctTgb17]